MRKREVDILNGPILKSLLIFSFPILLSNFINLMFNSMDLIVVGQFCGSHAIAAVGATSRIVNFTLCLFIGLSTGYGVVLSHAIGSGNKARIDRTVNTLIPLSVILGVILTVIGLSFSKTFLRMMNTPADIIDDAALYLRIYFSGAILRMVMAFVQVALRTAGDNRTPLKYLSIGGILNIVFNIVFVTVFDMSVDGVALGTVISEGTASVMGVLALMKRKDDVKLVFKNMCFDKQVIKESFRIGIPCGIQSGMFSFSTLIISKSINELGTVYVTAHSASVNINEIFLTSTATSLSVATSTFVGQNFGAENKQRVKDIAKCSIMTIMITEFILGIIMNVLSKQLLSIYITDNPLAIELGRSKMLITGLLYFIQGYVTIVSAIMRAMGDSKRPLYVSIAAVCIFKIVWVYTIFQIPSLHNFYVLIASYPASWVIDAVANTVIYRKDMQKMEAGIRI